MSEAIKKETIEGADETAEKRDTLSRLFEERDRPPLQEEIRLPLRVPKKETESAPSSPPRKEKGESDAAKVDDQDIVAPEIKSLQAELTKSRKVIADTQKFGHQNARKLKHALKITQELIERGSLSQSEAQSLVESLENGDSGAMLDAESTPYDSHPFSKVLKIANSELVTLRKYSEDELLDDKVKAFDYFLSLAPLEEIQAVLEDLSELSEEPVKLTKKMLSIGKHYYETSYKDIQAAGGVFAYIDKKNQDIDNLHKTIDKLKKKLSQYEDFDQPRYRLAEIGNGGDSADGGKDTITALFEERDRVKRR